MRVVQFIDSLRSGGKERQLVELLKGLVATPGIECELIIMSENIHYTYLDQLGVPIHPLLRKSKRDPTIFFKLYQLLKTIQPEILHSWSSMCSVYAVPAVKVLDIIFVNGFLRNAPPVMKMGERDWLRSKITFPFSDAIVANSKAGISAYCPPAQKSHYIYNGFDKDRITCLKKPDAVREEYQITTKFVVAMVASFSDNKDFQTFVNAAQKVIEQRKDVTFLAVGSGEHHAACVKSVPECYKNLIKFPGKVKDVESLIQIMDIGVLCSNANVHGEGISNTIMEYMAFAKPVVATACGGNFELILDGETGYLVPNSSASELTARLLFLLDNENLMQIYGERGALRLHKKFSLKRLTQEHIFLYERLIKAHIRN
jgi:glycosyltransferase involved in cell wall biosynthesis